MSGATGSTLRCWIYRGGRNGDAYLFVAERGVFDPVPRALLESLGKLELAMELELDASRRLARANAREVIAALHAQGYYLQLPPVDTPASIPLQ